MLVWQRQLLLVFLVDAFLSMVEARKDKKKHLFYFFFFFEHSIFYFCSFISCSSAMPAPTAAMTCGYDQYNKTNCQGTLIARSRVALGVCVALNGASVIYTDCSLNGQVSTFVQFSDTQCKSPSRSVTVTAPVAGRVCLGRTCGISGMSFRCNAVRSTVRFGRNLFCLLLRLR